MTRDGSAQSLDGLFVVRTAEITHRRVAELLEELRQIARHKASLQLELGNLLETEREAEHELFAIQQRSDNGGR